MDATSWRWIFGLNVPLAAGTLLLVFAAVPAGTRAAGRRVDVTGAALCSIGLAGVVFALIEEPHHGWGSTLIIVTLVGGLVSLAAFIEHERRAAQPMLDLELFAHRNFAVGNVETPSRTQGWRSCSSPTIYLSR